MQYALRKKLEAGESVEAYEEQPIPYDDLVEVWELFLALTQCGGDTVTDIESILNLYEVDDPDQRREYFELLAHLCNQLRRLSEEQAKKQQGTK